MPSDHTYTDHNGRRVDQAPYLTGTACVEVGCNEPAGTPWGPHWCPRHDTERIQRVTRGMERAKDALWSTRKEADDGSE